jgi:hypothetical protein
MVMSRDEQVLGICQGRRQTTFDFLSFLFIFFPVRVRSIEGKGNPK